MQTVEVQKAEKKYFFGRVGDDVWKARELLKAVSDIDVMPTIFGPPYVVFKAEVQEFRRAKDKLSGVLWIEMLGIRKLDFGHGELFISDFTQSYEAKEVQEFVEPLFRVYLRGAEDVKF